jgi:hypothetical protein
MGYSQSSLMNFGPISFILLPVIIGVMARSLVLFRLDDSI